MKGESTIKSKSKQFAIKLVGIYKQLIDEKHEFVMSKQLLRSATSIGANVVEAECGISTKDFLAKMYIAFKECAETLYWLDLLNETDYLTPETYKNLSSDCNELLRILSSITKTTAEKLTKKNNPSDQN